ncbi:universal stress protein (plasmid) [Natrinema zhouii]|uniref:universal stress protein n=1 Tax=Natrinema zhouii TaxID=1710539 RepID=UPI001CFF8CFC|nr:universal stress protein [Natrinema zhouii]UHQ98888.1 universal stress protein [Natrinema zhouii]
MVIIAAVDQTEPNDDVVREGRRLADAFGAPLHVVHALDRSTFIELERGQVEDKGETVPLEEVRGMGQTIASEALERIGVEGTPVGLVGEPAEEIIDYADRNDASHIVLGGRSRSPVGKALFGSVTQSVLLNTSRPVVSVHNEEA